MPNSLKDQLRIGMTYDEIVELLGDPTSTRRASDVLKKWSGAALVAFDPRDVSGLMYCCWKRKEAEYYLNIENGKLVKIDSVTPPVPGNI